MKRTLILLFIGLAGCTSRQTIKERTPTANDVTTTSESSLRLGLILFDLSEQSINAQSLQAEGTITLKEGGSSQSGSFDLKSKRLVDGKSIDSLSMVISGPFGITAAKFLGCPGEYCFYNALEGESYRGKPDPKALEQLTGMKGLTIEALNNVLFGLAPNAIILQDGEKPLLQTLSSDEYLMYIRRNGYTETFSLRTKSTPIVLTRYQRWNKPIELADIHSVTPDLIINYEGKYSSEHFRLPNFIKIQSRQKALEIEYTNATQNPKQLIVKIKMPE